MADFSSLTYCLNNERLSTNDENGVNYDLLRVINLDKIHRMVLFEDDWNGNGGMAFSSKAIRVFSDVIKALIKQPEIAPTGRNSLLMKYEFNDGTLLAFEVGEDRVDQVYIPDGDYDRAQIETYTEQIVQHINDKVEWAYGFKKNRRY